MKSTDLPVKRGVIFDLDGTLLNTIGDLGAACNYALSQVGLPPIPAAVYPTLVGNGVNALMDRAAAYCQAQKDGRQAVMITHEQLRPYFIPYYLQNACVRTRPYEGIPEVLYVLKEKGFRMAVASNKFQQATDEIVHFYFGNLFDIVFGERAGVPRKPNPQVVHDILSRWEDVEKVFYVGDSLVDVATAKAAGLPMIACAWGFDGVAKLAEAKPDYLIEKPQELLDLLLR